MRSRGIYPDALIRMTVPGGVRDEIVLPISLTGAHRRDRRLDARMIAPWSPGATSCVKSTEASASSRRYSSRDSAPAMHPTHVPRSPRSASLRCSSATTSETSEKNNAGSRAVRSG